MNETNTKSYLVAEERMNELTKRLDKLVRKSQKLGVAPVSYTLGGTQDLPFIPTNEGFRRIEDFPAWKARVEADTSPEYREAKLASVVYIRFQEVTVTGTNPCLAGWTFVATLQHLADDQGNVINMLRTSPNFEGQLPAQFRNATPEHCDHCHKFIKTRKETFVVTHEDGTWKQVGRNCLADFLGGQDPQAIAAALDLMLRMFDDMSDAEDESFGGFGGDNGPLRFGMERFLAVTAMLVRSEGWTSRGKSRASDGALPATADLALDYLSPPPRDSRAADEHMAWVRAHPVLAEDTEVAQKAMEYAREDLMAKGEQRSDYEHNLYVATIQKSVDFKLAGITASLIAYYLKEIERRVIREAELRRVADSKYLGKVGDKLTLVGVSCAKVIPCENQFGTSYLHKLIDAEGNALTWFSSNSDNNLAPGETYIIKGTVKKHEDYQGVKQTALTRLAVVTPEEFKAAQEKAARKAAREAKKAAQLALNTNVEAAPASKEE